VAQLNLYKLSLHYIIVYEGTALIQCTLYLICYYHVMFDNLKFQTDQQQNDKTLFWVVKSTIVKRLKMLVFEVRQSLYNYLISSLHLASCSFLLQYSSFCCCRLIFSSWSLRALILGLTSTWRCGSTFFYKWNQNNFMSNISLNFVLMIDTTVSHQNLTKSLILNRLINCYLKVKLVVYHLFSWEHVYKQCGVEWEIMVRVNTEY
jgi:hypothetical protein